MGDKKLRKNSAEDSKPNLLKDQMVSIRRSCAEVSSLLDRMQETDKPEIDAIKA